MTARRTLVAALVALAVAGVAGCGVLPGPADTEPTSPSLPRSEGTITGPLVDIRRVKPIGDSTTGLLGTVLIEPSRSSPGLAMVFDITDRTVLYDEYAGLGESELSELSFSDLTTCEVAQVGYSGPIRASHPAQATADYVVLQDPGS